MRTMPLPNPIVTIVLLCSCVYCSSAKDVHQICAQSFPLSFQQQGWDSRKAVDEARYQQAMASKCGLCQMQKRPSWKAELSWEQAGTHWPSQACSSKSLSSESASSSLHWNLEESSKPWWIDRLIQDIPRSPWRPTGVFSKVCTPKSKKIAFTAVVPANRPSM